MNEPVATARCVAVAGVATGPLAALAAFLLPDLEAAAAAFRAAPTGAGGMPGPSVRRAPGPRLCAGGSPARGRLAVGGHHRGHRPRRPRAGGRGGPGRAGAACADWSLVACGAALARHDGRARPRPRRPRRAAAARPRTGSAASPPPPPAASPGRRRRSPRRCARRRSRRRPPRGHAVGPRRAAPAAGRRRPPRSPPAGTAIHALNRAVIGADPDLIQPGQRLRLPRR